MRQAKAASAAVRMSLDLLQLPADDDEDDEDGEGSLDEEGRDKENRGDHNNSSDLLSPISRAGVS